MVKPRKKKSNPGIASKKRKTKLQKRRSEAAKKGWQTRRINLLQLAKVTKPKKSNKKLTSHAEKDLLIERLQKLVTEKWVHAAEDEMLHRDGSLAVQPSRLRHWKDADGLRKSMQEERAIGELRLAAFVQYWADEWDIPAQEFYTLLMSP